MDAVEVRKSAADLRAIWVLSSTFRKPHLGLHLKEDREAAAARHFMALNLSASRYPRQIPTSSAKMLSAMNWIWNGHRCAGVECPARWSCVPPARRARAKITDDARAERASGLQACAHRACC